MPPIIYERGSAKLEGFNEKLSKAELDEVIHRLETWSDEIEAAQKSDTALLDGLDALKSKHCGEKGAWRIFTTTSQSLFIDATPKWAPGKHRNIRDAISAALKREAVEAEKPNDETESTSSTD